MMSERSSHDNDDADVYSMMANIHRNSAEVKEAPSRSSRKVSTQELSGRGSFNVSEDDSSRPTSSEAMAAAFPESVRQAVFENPKVQEAVRKSEKARESPLSDPAVQQQILSVCYERHPEVAEFAPAAIAQWGKDPQAQKQAQKAAGVTPTLAAVAGLFVGPNRGVDVVNQGSPAVRLLAFIGGATCIVMSVFPVVNPVVMFTHTLMWLIHFYQLIFSVSTLIFEAKPEWIKFVKALDTYKAMLIDNAKFLAKCLGRGMFYIFQGTLWLALGYSAPVAGEHQKEAHNWFGKFYHVFAHILGGYMILLGFAHILMHWGIMPSHYAISLNRAGTRASGRLQSAMESLRARRAAGGDGAEGAAEAGQTDRQVELSSRSASSF